MNLAVVKKEISNIVLLKKILLQYGISLGFWSLADGLVRRLGMRSLYEKTHYRRYEVCKTYLRKHYGGIVSDHKQKGHIDPGDPIQKNSTIWVFWWQGEENAPYPVNLCMESVRRNAGLHPVVVLDQNNYDKYVEIPEYVLKKFREGKISIAHFSDILRISLLKRYGGIWLDSTFYLTAPLQEDLYDYSFFSISHGGHRKWVVSKDLWSLGLLASGKNSAFMDYCYDMLMEYWKKENIPICYLLLDCMMSLGFEDILEFRALITKVPVNNLGVFDFLEEIRNQKCDEKVYQKLSERAYIHQLTYKKDYRLNVRGGKTYFGRLTEEAYGTKKI